MNNNIYVLSTLPNYNNPNVDIQVIFFSPNPDHNPKSVDKHKRHLTGQARATTARPGNSWVKEQKCKVTMAQYKHTIPHRGE